MLSLEREIKNLIRELQIPNLTLDKTAHHYKIRYNSQLITTHSRHGSTYLIKKDLEKFKNKLNQGKNT